VDPPAARGLPAKPVDAHLRSTQAVHGYQLQAIDGVVGCVSNFMMDTGSWAMPQLVVKTGHRFSGKEQQIPTSRIDRISWDDSTVFVNLSRESLEQSSRRLLAPLDPAA
jgi:hypothetical protein